MGDGAESPYSTCMLDKALPFQNPAVFIGTVKMVIGLTFVGCYPNLRVKAGVGFMYRLGLQELKKWQDSGWWR